MKNYIVLNESRTSSQPSDMPLDGALAVELAEIKAQFMDMDTGLVDYSSIKGSEAFERYKGLAASLRELNLGSLRETPQKKAFWINVYNAAVVHGVIELGIKRSVREFRGFFKRVAYRIGGFEFSLSDMEHGILRSNSRAPGGIRRPFSSNDPRRSLCVDPLDPRIHFALVCGARSCPPIGFYKAENVEVQLDLAASFFINSDQVEVFPERGEVLISKIFKWYRGDFGRGKRALLDFIIHYMDEGEARGFLMDRGGAVRIRYKPYDWSLNTH
jgi:hypothetical protein